MKLKTYISHKHAGVVIGITIVFFYILINLSFPYIVIKKTFFDIRPILTDEVLYWHQMLTFSKVGFNGGYYAINEIPAPASFSHFGFHGPTFPMLYGTVGRFFGWYFWSATLYNVVLLTVALIIFVLLIKPNFKQSVVFGLVLFTFWPTMLYLPTIMQQIIHQVFAILLVILFWNIIKKGVETSLAFKTISFLFILFISLLRPTWAFLFFPFFLFSFPLYSKPRLLMALLGATIANILSFLIFKSLSSAYPLNFVSHFLSTINHSFYNSIELLFNHLLKNIAKFFTPGTGYLTAVLLRVNLMVLISAFVIIFIRNYRSKHIKGKADALCLKIQRRETLFNLLNLCMPLIFCLFFYDFYSLRDYRLLAPSLFLSLLILIKSQKRLWLVCLIVVINLFGVKCFKYQYLSYPILDRFIYDEQKDILFFKSIKGFLKYEAEKPPWCNTVLTSGIAPTYFTYLPAGFGFSMIFHVDDHLQLPVKSKYLLLDESEKHTREWSKKLNKKMITSTPYGTLYLNKDCTCD